MSVTVVDYGVGNIANVVRALVAVGADVSVSSEPREIEAAHRIVLPGVGAFGSACDHLLVKNLVESLKNFSATGRPLLGICLGMQLLFDASDESPESQGLEILSGKVVKIPTVNGISGKRKVPNVGWRKLTLTTTDSDDRNLLNTVHGKDLFYFVHSFSAVPTKPNICMASSYYEGYEVTAAVQQGNIFGVQFHPEKSGLAGLRLLRRFAELS